MTEASVSFAGNLTDEPQVRATEAGIARAMFRVAVSGRREQEAPFFALRGHHDRRGAGGVHAHASGSGGCWPTGC